MNNKSLFILLFLFASCMNRSESGSSSESGSCCKYRKSYALSENLFIEEYYIYQAVPFTEMVTIYLTDSVNFKTSIANRDERMEYKAVYDSINKCVTVVGLEYLGKIDSIKIIDTVNINDFIKSQRMDTAFKGVVPVIGEDIECSNPIFQERYTMSENVWPVPKGLTLFQENNLCGKVKLSSYYLTDNKSFRVLLKINKTGDKFNYLFKSYNDTLMLVQTKKSDEVYDTLYRNEYFIDTLIKNKVFISCDKN